MEKTSSLAAADHPCVCPFEATLAVAEQQTVLLRYSHEADRRRAIAGIVMTRAALDMLRQEFPCPKTDNSANCPLREWVAMARSNAAGRWKPEDFAADMSAGVNVLAAAEPETAPTTNGTGQYL